LWNVHTKRSATVNCFTLSAYESLSRNGVTLLNE